jgi:L,D-peptidoglycan transpeptidase YkuD (ErfK/YbiS/YcfS/YnhG family)
MRSYTALMALFCACVGASGTFAQTCPAPMRNASHLVLVTVPELSSSTGQLRLFERPRVEADWRLVRSAEPVMVGRKGVAWSRAFRDLASDGEPLKVEGDDRSPAGIYWLGRPFGFAASSLANYLQIDSDSVCVEDPASSAYNKLTSRRVAGLAASKESMRATPLYRRGLVVNYPTDAANRAGSCIFLHVWKRPGKGTAGCVTMPESRVAALQAFANRRATVIAILPESVLGRLAACLPPTVVGAR